MRTIMRLPRLVLPLLILAGCSPDYPMDKEGTWSIPPVSANDTNLRAMVVNPQDLVSGHGERTALGAEGTRPVNNLFNGKRPALPDMSASAIYGVPASAPGGGAGGQ
jgi:hypothetical protein